MSKRDKISLVLLCIAICAASPLLRHYQRQQQRDRSVRPADLYHVVYSQFSAVRTEDYTRAYWQASSGIRGKFSREQFIAMIRKEYPGIDSAARIEFGAVRSRERHAVIQVFFTDHGGIVTPAIYSLVYEGEEWKIDGARMMRRWPDGTRLRGLRS